MPKRTGPSLNRHRSKQDYRTPKPFLDAVKAILSIKDFAIDLAADRHNRVCRRCYSEENSALLHTNWRAAGILPHEWAWLNPPFNDIAPWAKRCYTTIPGRTAFLAPASVGSNWFNQYVHEEALVLFLNGRLSFDGLNPYPKDCMLCLYGLTPGYRVWTWTLDRDLLLP